MLNNNYLTISEGYMDRIEKFNGGLCVAFQAYIVPIFSLLWENLTSVWLDGGQSSNLILELIKPL